MSEPRTAARGPGLVQDRIGNRADIESLARLHRQFLDNLNELDRLGEHVTAAYLTAAVDALEARLTAAGRTIDPRHDGMVALTARGLAARLGDRAVEVARAQLVDAEGEALVVWTAIVNQLESR